MEPQRGMFTERCCLKPRTKCALGSVLRGLDLGGLLEAIPPAVTRDSD